MKQYDELKKLVDGIADDVNKTDAGNAAAARRVRKHMQEIKNKVQEIRVAALAETKPNK